MTQRLHIKLLGELCTCGRGRQVFTGLKWRILKAVIAERQNTCVAVCCFDHKVMVQLWQGKTVCDI